MVPLAIDIVTSELTGRPSPIPSLKEQHIPYYGVKAVSYTHLDVYKRQLYQYNTGDDENYTVILINFIVYS